MTIISNGPLEFKMMASPEVTTFSLVVSAVPQARVEQEGQLPATHLPELKGRRVPLGKRSLCPWNKEPMGTLVTLSGFYGEFYIQMFIAKGDWEKKLLTKRKEPTRVFNKTCLYSGLQQKTLGRDCLRHSEFELAPF